MRAGPIRQPLTIQTKGESEDATGAPTESWISGAQVWGNIEYLAGDELDDAHAVSERITHRITVRGHVGLTGRNRFLFGETVFDIVSVNNVREIGAEMICLCEEIR